MGERIAGAGGCEEEQNICLTDENACSIVLCTSVVLRVSAGPIARVRRASITCLGSTGKGFRTEAYRLSKMGTDKTGESGDWISQSCTVCGALFL